MPFLNNLTIRRKLLLYLALPLVFAVAASSLFVVEQYRHLQNAQKTQAAINLSLSLADIIHELQKERGLSAGLSGGKGDHFVEDLRQVRKLTDLTISRLKGHQRQYLSFPQSDAQQVKLEREFTVSQQRFVELLQLRKQIDQSPGIDTFEFYSKLIAHLLHFIKVIQLDLQSLDLALSNNEFLTLLLIQEKAGQERGALNGIFAGGQADTGKLLKISTWSQMQYDLLKELSETATPATKSQIEHILASQIEQEVAAVRSMVKKFVHRKEKLGNMFTDLAFTTLADRFFQLQLTPSTAEANALSKRIVEAIDMIGQSPALPLLMTDERQQVSAIVDTLLRMQSQLDSQQPLDIGQLGLTNVSLAIHQLYTAAPRFDSVHWWAIASQRLNLFHDVSREVANKLPRYAENTAYTAELLVLSVAGLFLLSFGTTSLLAHLLQKRMVGEIKSISSCITQMERSKDFNQKLDIHGKDEIAEMATAFNNLIDAKRVAQAQSRISSRVFENISEAIVITDKHNRFKMVNPAFTRITGYRPEEVIGRTPKILKSGMHDVSFYQHMWKSLNQDGLWQGEVQNKHKDGHIYAELLSISVIHNARGEVEQYIGLFSDLSEHKKNEHKIWCQANFDQLTGLPNRAYFFETLKSAVELAETSTNHFALLFIDLDRFKYVNDTFGHSAGDELLKVVSQRMKTSVKDTDVVARIGGDEFVVLLRDLKQKCAAEQVVARILDCVESPIQVDQSQEIVVSASVGITFYPEDGTCIESLMQNSDTAMYQAKAKGRNTYSFFNTDMQQAVIQRLELEQDLRKAALNQCFVLHYQPIFNLNNQQIVGAEALVRWQHPDKGLVAPDKFISIAEELKLIDTIGEWVLNQALKDLQLWHQSGHNLHVAVNISGKQTNLGAITEHALSRQNIAPEYLKIEITESMLIERENAILEEIIQFKKLGVGVHLDDFGTGYSSLSYLSKFPADLIKIDRTFLKEWAAEEPNYRLVEAVVTIAKSLKMQLVAEGIETSEQLDYLNQLGCDYGQGYLISKPLENRQLLAFLSTRAAA